MNRMLFRDAGSVIINEIHKFRIKNKFGYLLPLPQPIYEWLAQCLFLSDSLNTNAELSKRVSFSFAYIRNNVKR